MQASGSTANSSPRWRLSASLIIVTPEAAAGEDYNVLMLKRTDAIAVATNQTVFPGGLLEVEADESVAWLQYFEEFGVLQASLRGLVLISEQRPTILAPQGTGCYDRFFKRSKIWAREITLRLAALRECFEEVGVLLCRNRAQVHQTAAVAQAAQLDADSLKTWQARVHSNPSDFLALCRHLEVVPDLWALHEWSAWASPAFVKNGYETVFYMVFLQSQPSLLIEPTEVKEGLWRSPLELLRLHQNQELFFLPPQIYELGRLYSINDFQKLCHFASQRGQLGCTMFMPVGYVCSDGMVFALPGDDLYVPEPHLVTKPIEFSGTVAELNARSKYLHRYESTTATDFQIHINIPTLNGHLVPKQLPNEKCKL
ncbi:nucleoside diphosphate-linked moiety X motif 19 [Drosophila mojavensis]|uniref:Nudix hydrolase domain-containing protein n=1 Tax=Drosophila mojavensis TaxID=7230 RepID=B4KIH3_DROMO|nr:nucleoside diphosphate-linked moiety X motif 19 [Drosophila mojavensis]EDW13470.2 uncharacterized protein Dmoj_GI19813 [Drosophila mojavensis]